MYIVDSQLRGADVRLHLVVAVLRGADVRLHLVAVALESSFKCLNFDVPMPRESVCRRCQQAGDVGATDDNGESSCEYYTTLHE